MPIEPLFACRLTCDACGTFARHETRQFSATASPLLGNVEFAVDLPGGWFEHNPHKHEGHFENWSKRFVCLLWALGLKPDLSHDGKQWCFLLCPDCATKVAEYSEEVGGFKVALEKLGGEEPTENTP